MRDKRPPLRDVVRLVVSRIPHPASRIPPRAGFTLMEVVVASAIIGVLFVVTVPLLSHVRVVREEADRRMIATQEAASVMEAVAVLSQRGELDRQATSRLSLSPSADRLPDGSLEIALDDAAEPFSGQKVTVSVAWTTGTGKGAPPVALVAWFPTQGGE